MGLFIAGPVLLTLFWLIVVIGAQRVPGWLMPAELGFSVAAFLLSMALIRAGGAPILGAGGHSDVPPSDLANLVTACGFYIFMSSMSGILWCFVLSIISLPIGLLLAHRQNRLAELDESSIRVT